MRQFNVRVVTCLPVCLALVIGSAASAQTPRAVGGFVSGNIGVILPASDALTNTAGAADGVDSIAIGLTQPMSASPAVDFGGGVIVRNRWVFGASFDRTAETSPAEVVLTLRHPEYHPTLTGTAATEPLERVEQGLHFSVGMNVPITSAFSLRVFGGPSYLTRDQAILDDLDFHEPQDQVTGAYSAKVDWTETKQVHSSAWGYHVGADGSYFFSKYVGVGGQLRYSRATFETENALQSRLEDRPMTDRVTGGGLSLAAGIRIRF